MADARGRWAIPPPSRIGLDASLLESSARDGIAIRGGVAALGFKRASHDRFILGHINDAHAPWNTAGLGRTRATARITDRAPR